MSEPMLERVARAICGSYLRSSAVVPRTVGARVDDLWPLWGPEAKAALEALMEPDEGMLIAACEVGPDTNAGQFDMDSARTVFTAMIQSALSSQTPAPGGGSRADDSMTITQELGSDGEVREL